MKGSPRFGPSRQSVLISFAGCCLFALLLTPAFLIVGLVGGFFLGGVLGMLCTLMLQESKLKPSLQDAFSYLIRPVGQPFLEGLCGDRLGMFYPFILI